MQFLFKSLEQAALMAPKTHQAYRKLIAGSKKRVYLAVRFASNSTHYEGLTDKNMYNKLLNEGLKKI